MAGSFRSIFKGRQDSVVTPPQKTKPLMRVLEPRVLLDAAAVETALDIAGQAAHSQLADDFMADSNTVDENDPSQTQNNASTNGLDEFAEDNSQTGLRGDREVVFIDAAVENIDELIATLEPGVTIHQLDGDSDGIEQIASILSQSGGYEAIHIFSHGTSGGLQLGNTSLDARSIEGRHSEPLRTIGAALGDNGDILIYGCNFGQGAEGEIAAKLLSDATGADIAASDDLTGAESLAGDWDLELNVGHVETSSFTLPDWQGILAGYELQANSPPVFGHLDDGIVGTANTTATWENAVVFDPGGAAPVETYDIRATLIGLTDNMSATFETVASTNGSMDDFRVVVTNIGNVVGNVGGQDVVEEGSVSISWAIYEAGTDTLAPPNAMNIIFSDIEGLAGTPDTRETVAVETDEAVSYTVNTGSDLQVAYGEGGLNAVGTVQGTGLVGSQLAVTWASANQFVVTYTSRTLITNFDIDGDRDLTAFPTPETTLTQNLDLNGNAAGNDYTTVYVNQAQPLTDVDVPLAIADVNMSIFDLDSQFLQSATVTLTNASAGDKINFDTTLLDALGLSANLTDNVTNQVLEITGFALISNYETAIQSLTYSNDNDNDNFDRSSPRVFDFEISDGVITTTGVQTTVLFGTAGLAPVAGTNIYVEDEDTTIFASAANGLLSDDADPQGDSITVISALDSNNDPIVIGVPHTMPSGASLTLNSDGGFTYIPALNYSGNETITYTVSDGTFTSNSFATFDIQPVIDDVSLTVVQPTPLANEDITSAPIDVSTFSADPSENQIVLATNIPNGVVLTDGINTFTAGNGIFDVEITSWDRTQLRVLPVQNSDVDVVITFVTENFEVDGSISFDSQAVTFEFDAVADTPVLIVEQAFGGIDDDVPLSDIISVQLFDVDGSETITDITISNLPAGAQVLVNSVPLTITGNAASFGVADIPNLVFRPPATGTSVVYNLLVSATATETNAENGVATASATRSGVGLTIDLNDQDDPVVAVDDQASTFAGESVNIDVLQNDFVPDGAPLVTHVNGVLIDVLNPVTLPGGQGVVSISPFGNLVFSASDTFGGQVQFTYTVQDSNLSTDTGLVTVAVQPRWALSSIPTTTEGSAARFVVDIEGTIGQGQEISVDLAFEEGAADASDYESLSDAINDSIAAFSQTDFSFNGTTLTYTAPATNYSVVHETNAAANFFDISATGDPLALGNSNIALRAIGFNFDFYDDQVTDVYISADGYLTFGSPGVGSNNESLDGSALSGRPIIAPFWDDLNTASGSVFVETVGATAGQRQFIIQWEGIQNQSDASGTGSFQIVLDEASSQIRFNYRDVVFDGVGDNGAGATIGLQSSSGVADEFSFNGTTLIGNDHSIVFSRESLSGVQLLIDADIIDDPIFEDVEDFGLRLTNSVNSAIGLDNTSVTIAVSDNAAPVVADDVIMTSETGTGTVNVITNPAGLDTDLDGHVLQIAEVAGVSISTGTAVNLPSGATVGVNLDGQLTYNPNGAFAHLAENEPGVDTFTYRVVDAFGSLSATAATVTVNIIGENQATVIDLDDNGSTSATTNRIDYGPLETTMLIAATDSVITDPDDTNLASVQISLDGFVQPGNERLHFDNQVIVYGTASSPTVTTGSTTFLVDYDGATTITLTESGGGEMLITDLQSLIRLIAYENNSNDDTRGDRTVTFIPNDGDVDGAAAVAEINVIGNNVAPVAGDDGTPVPFSTPEDTSVMITLSLLLLNDTDVDLDPLSIVSVDGGPNGAAVLDGSGNVIYTPGSDFVGSTFFTYVVEDGAGAQDTGTVFVDVTPVDDAPRIDLDSGTAGLDYAFTYVENDAPTSIISPTGSVVEVDGEDLIGAEVNLTNGQLDDVFNVGSLPAGISASVVPAEATTGLTAPATVTIQLMGTASAADYETAIRSIGFSSNSDVPSTALRTVTVTASDAQGASLIATTSISVIQVNDEPVTQADTGLNLDEDTSITITPSSLLANDSDPDGDALTLVSVQDAVNGTVGINGDGDVVFVSDPDFFGAAQFSYTAEDGLGGSTVQTVDLVVNSVNDAAVITLDTGSGDGNYSTGYIENAVGVNIVSPTIDIVDVDHTDLQGATITLINGQIGDVLEVGSLPGGILASVVPSTPLTAAGSITVTLSEAASLADYQSALQLITYRSVSDAPSVVDRQISVQVNDGLDTSNIGTTTIAVTAVNDAPVAVDDNTISFDEDSARNILPAELLANDFDPDLEPVTIVSVQDETNGTVVLNGDGTITFTPVTDYFGPASFTYTIDDGNGEQATATVNLTVNSVNDITQVDLDDNTVGTGYTANYIENGIGLAVVDPSIQILDVDDNDLLSATVTLTNGQVGDILEVGGLPSGISVSIVPPTALVAPGTITVSLTGTASRSDYQLALAAVTYRSNSDALSTVDREIDVVTFDGDDPSDTARSVITITAVNDLPLPAVDTFSIDEDTQLELAPAALLFNDSDPDGDFLTISSVGGAVNGSVVINGAGNVVFTPDTDFSGPASFTYTADDGNGGTATATVNVTVNAVNDAPTIDLNSGDGGGIDYTTSYTEGGTPAVISDASVLLNDVDGSALVSVTITLTNGQTGDLLEAGALPSGIVASGFPAGGLIVPGSASLTLSGSASFADYQTAIQAVTFSTVSNDPATVDRTLSIVANDGLINSTAAITTIGVTAVNDIPVAGPDGVFTVDEDVPFSVSTAALLFNDTDGENDPLSVTAVQNPTNGTVVLVSGTVTFTPDPDYFGPASFEYTLEDDNGGTTTGVVSLDIVAINDAPTLDLNTATAGDGHVSSFTENGPAANIVDATVTIGDVDGVTVAGAEIVLSDGQIGDRLSVGSLPTGITATITPPGALISAGSITVELSGVSDALTYQTALQAVTFDSVSENPSTAARTLFTTVNDGVVNSATSTTTITVVSVNDVPVVQDDGVFTIDEDTTFSISSSALLFNDSDPEGDAMSVISVQDAMNGTVVLAGTGEITFTPDADYSGPASFTYTVRDALGGESTATVNLTVIAINDLAQIDLNAATAGNGNIVTYVENAAGSPLVDASVLLSDVDGTDFASATFVLTNGQPGDVLEVGSLPTGISASVVPASPLLVAGQITVTLSGVAPNLDYATALQAVSFRSTSDDPTAATRTVSVSVNDGLDESAIVTSNVVVNVINDAPVAGPDGVFSFNEDTVFTVPSASLLLNDSDPENDALSIVSVQDPVNGTVVMDGAGLISFTPDLGYFGPASFTYTLEDANGAQDIATVDLDVLILNDPPIVDLDASGAGDGFTTAFTENGTGIAIVDSDISIFDEDHANMVEATIVLSNGHAGDILEVGGLPTGMTASVVPSAALTGDGTITLTLTGVAPLTDYEAALQQITYRSLSENPNTDDRTIEIAVSDGLDFSSIVTTRVSVNAVNDAPIALDDGNPTPLVVTEDTPFVFNPVTSNDSDFENDTLTIQQINGLPISPSGGISITGGVLDLALDGTTLTFTPSLNFFGPVSFDYTISDGEFTDTARVDLNVEPVNDTPVAVDDGPVILVEDGLAFFDPVTPNDSDVEGDPLNIIAIDGQAIVPTVTVFTNDGEITLGADGRTLQFVPNAQFNGLSPVTYTLSDGTSSSDAVVTFDVTPVDDPLTLAGPIPDMTLNDSDVVNLPMAGYFIDPDGDALLFSATGLPAGLSINATTGVVSGVVDSSASQSGPYTVTISVNDGVASVVSSSFDIDVLNIAPVAARQSTIMLSDGASFSYSVVDLFSDADNDALAYSANGLPSWVSFDPLLGRLSGTVPSDASVFGSVVVELTVTDVDGASAATNIILDPRNIVPEATTQLEDVVALEGDDLSLNIAGLFIDGGTDRDELMISVTGLPQGIEFDPTVGLISGTYESGSGTIEPYLVTILADDGQGGTTTVTFSITVNNPTFIEESDPLASLADLVEVESNDREPADVVSPVGEALDTIAPLGGTVGLDGRTGILLSAIGNIDPLYEATLSGSEDGLPEQIDAMDAMAVSTDWLSESGREGNGDWNVSGTFGYQSLMDEKAERDALSGDDRLERLSIDAVRRQGALYIEFNDQLDPKRDGRIVKISFSYPDDKPLPAWMKVIREGFISAAPPDDVTEIPLTVSAALGNGTVLTKEVMIDTATGAVIEAEGFNEKDALEPKDEVKAEKLVDESLKEASNIVAPDN